MKAILVNGTEAGRALADYLRGSLEATVSGVSVLYANDLSAGPRPDLVVSVLDAPLEDLEIAARRACGAAEVVLVEWGTRFEGATQLGLEAEMKEATGAAKVLIYEDEDGRLRAFRKVLDVALSRVGGARMPDDIPQEVIEAVKKEAVGDRIPCERAQALAGELGVPIPVVGRALDLLNIKIVGCQLGCF